MLRRFLWHWLILVVGIDALVHLPFSGINCQTGSDLVWAALVLLFAQKLLRPVLVFFTFPIVILTLGFFLLIINALILELVPHLVPGFHVRNFGFAFLDALILSLLSWIFLGATRSRRTWKSDHGRRQVVIDI